MNFSSIMITMRKIKRMLTPSVCLVFAILLLTNCRSNKDNQIQNIEIDFTKNVVIDTVFLKNLKVVHLETNNSATLNAVDKIFLSDNKIFVFDKPQSKVVLFNSEGKYLRHLQQLGRGPTEYSALLDVFVDTKNKEIHLMTDYPHKIMTFDYNMNYISELKLEELYLEFVLDDGAFICRRAETENNIPNSFYVDVIDKETGAVLRSQLPITANSEQLNRIQIPGSMLTKTSSTLFTTLESDDIFEIDKEHIRKKYSFDLKKDTIGEDNPVQIVNMVEAKNFLMFKTKKGLYVYDREKNKMNRYSRGIMNLSILNGGLSQYLPISNNPEKVAFIGLPSIMKIGEGALRERMKNTKDTVGVNHKFLNFASKLELGDNPLLFIYDFK